ncbi:MAG TPA: hypothetical protein VGE98_13900 [Thermoanaerobaculia bacterium]
MTEHTIELAGDPERVRTALATAAEGWGAELEPAGDGYRLQLSVVAGLRRGVVSGTLAISPVSEGSRLVFYVENESYRVHLAPVAVLVVAALGSLVVLAWPFFPGLLGLAPFGALLALGGWFLVVSQLRSSGPKEFLDSVAAELARDGETDT